MKDTKDLEIWKEYSKNIDKLESNTISKKIHHHKISSFVATEKTIQSKSIVASLPHFQTRILPISTFTKKEKRNLKVEAQIDLHGKFAEDVNIILQNFCLNCITKNIKTAIIISGKGNGIIRNEVNNWILNNSMFVAKYSAVKDSKNEVGSFCIYLRSKNFTKHSK